MTGDQNSQRKKQRLVDKTSKNAGSKMAGLERGGYSWGMTGFGRG